MNITISAPFQGVVENKTYKVDELLALLEKIQIQRMIREGKHFYFPLTLEDQPIRFYTPPLILNFGLQKYKYRKNVETDPYKYSIFLGTSKHTESHYHSMCLFEALDMIAYQHHQRMNQLTKEQKEDYTLFSPLRPNYKDDTKPLTLRVKIPFKEPYLKCQLFRSEGTILPTVEQFEKYVPENSTVKCLLEVNPIYYSERGNDKEGFRKIYGVSYKLVAIAPVNTAIHFD